MASFTDTQAPRFNPYIQQQPVEAMVAVGTQKQKAHDEGVQKIQTQIDNLASIDVGRDVDKAYLQSKINEMGNNLRSVAAGDFSNFQLVNSVGGMIKQISYDPYIRTAVASTANDRKQTELMEEDRKSGKLTPHSEYYYGMKRNKYYSNNSLKGEGGRPIGFSGKYVQSWDIDKALVEAIDSVGDSKWSADMVYKMIDGQIMKDKNGNPILSDYAIRQKREGKFSENVSAAINNVLNRPEAKQELTMRGVYNYRGYDSIEDFVQSYEREKNKSITKYEGRKLELMEKAAGATTKQERIAYQKLIDEVDGAIEKTKQDTELLESDARQFNSVEGYKAALETIKTRNGYMKSGVTEQISTEIIENIPWKASRQVLKEERDWNMALDASKRGWAGVEISRGNLAVSQAELALKAEQWEYDPKNPKSKLGTSTAVLAQGNKYESVYSNFFTASAEADKAVESNKYSIVSEYMAAINYGNGKTVSKEDIDKSIKSWEKKSPGFIDRMYERAKGVQKDPKLARNPLYSNLMAALPAAYSAEEAQQYMSDMTDNMNKSAGVRDAGGKEVDLSTVAKNFKPFEVEYMTDDDFYSFGFTPKYTKKTVNAQDAMDLAIVSKNTGLVKGIWKSVTNTEAQQKQYEDANARIQSKFGTSGQSLLRSLNRGGGVGTIAQSLSPYVSRRDVTHPELGKVMDVVDTHKFDNVLAAKEKYLRDSGWSAQPVSYSLYEVDMKGPERTSVDDRMKEVLHKYSGAGGVAEFDNLYTKPKEYSAQIAVDRGAPFAPKEDWSINLYAGGGKVKTLPISREDAEYIKQYQINLPQVASQTAQRIQSGGNTTNASKLPPNHPEAYRGAMIKGQVFAQKFNTTKALGADVVASPSGGFNAYIYTTDPVSGQNIGVPVKRDKGDIYPAPFNTADDATRFLMEGINSKTFLDNVINNGL